MTALHFEVSGPAGAPVLVLGPSLGTDLSMWRPQLDALSRSYRVLRYDQRGHHHSAVPPGPYRVADLGRDVQELLAAQHVDGYVYCGLSLGGMVGLWLASQEPGRISRLALLCTAAHLPPAQGWLDRAAQVRAHGTASVGDASLGRWFTPAYRQANDLTRWREMLAALPDEGYAGCCEAIAAMDQRADLARITADTLVIAGADDPATPPAFGAEIASGIPGARFVVVPAAAHLANVEQPETVTSLLVDHFGRADG